MPNVAAPRPASPSVCIDYTSVPPFGAGDRSPAQVRQSLSFKPLAAVNDTFFDAAIVMASPVAGLRP
jgi:hypothetical protein